ncbi:acyltransferase family protein [Acinetobacter sp. R933-2]|uniref:acyltransferase family protein n=1 Tax=Acinetobacter sp. R933-2 TaxID=2746728 RepID=UPI002575BCBB|nr:acyltransferase family protein [Acinetobacter sp. R933-2]MDM1245958.1 acyltransferase family protein [Acinetobacter sp. R933-2]
MRNSFLDSSKAVLIFLVVFGHFLERMIGWHDPISHTVLATIYLIHMPAFIFVSGIFYKDQNWLKNILFFLSLYIPFQFLFIAFESLWSGQFHWNWNVLIKPYWVLWYLLGMMVWTALTHFLIQVSNQFALFLCILLSILIGLSPWNNYLYSVGRIFVFFPFFILGALYGKAVIAKIQQSITVKWWGVVGLFVCMILMYFVQINQYWLYGSLSYTQLKVSAFDGIFTRILCLMLSTVGMLALFSVMHFFQGKWLKLGIYTLPVYLLHGFVVILIARYWKLDVNVFAAMSICFVLSVLTCWILQQSVFDRVLRKISLWLMQPTQKLLPVKK